MNDRYLFRAKRIDNGEWVVGDLSHHKTGKVFVKPLNGSAISTCEVDKDTICQCTGLKDKNGKLIWENDVMVAHLDDRFPEDATYTRVVWNNNGFCTKMKGSDGIFPLDKFDQENFEVCGNLFDNPELIHE